MIRFTVLLIFLAVSSSDAGMQIESMTKLVTFDGASGTTFSWKALNDPVMGGASSSTWTIDSKGNKTAVWDGEVRIVPSLKAPGFCNAETTNWFAKFSDASGYSHWLLRVRSTTPDYPGFKTSFAADTINTQFKSHKANFKLANTTDWQTVAIPFSSFSNDWSSFTGDCDTVDPNGKTHRCCSTSHPEVCPSQKNLRDISVVGLWMEGHAGKFHLEVAWMGAGNISQSLRLKTKGSASPPSDPTTCSAPIQKGLKYNVSGRLAKDYLMGGNATETLAQAICCDAVFKPYAEPAHFYARPDVNLFGGIKEGQTVTFYDSVCGIPLFIAPRNRTLAAWKEESYANGWPSFRPEELVKENVMFKEGTGEAVSKCGTHLGANLPDKDGPRYCIDLVCISGQPSIPVYRFT